MDEEDTPQSASARELKAIELIIVDYFLLLPAMNSTGEFAVEPTNPILNGLHNGDFVIIGESGPGVFAPSIEEAIASMDSELDLELNGVSLDAAPDFGIDIVPIPIFG